ncbi:hypothetical protein FKM82_010433 [Ascaphus truei]
MRDRHMFVRIRHSGSSVPLTLTHSSGSCGTQERQPNGGTYARRAGTAQVPSVSSVPRPCGRASFVVSYALQCFSFGCASKKK